jgi:hypothetical protein
MSYTPLEEAEGRRVGTVDFVAPNEIKVQLDLDAPDNTALNTGTPRAFPRINGYVLVPGDAGFIVGQIEWLAVERSSFPKRKGLQDFGLIDLPFPLRRLALNPVGTLVQRSIRPGEEGPRFRFQRGVYFFPSIGDPVVLPTSQQLRDIVESGDARHVLIGHAPQAGNAEVRVDPDRLFGRHLAVLGNTGSGKSCTVAGLVQWSLQAAKQERGSEPPARFIILDPNGEYANTFACAAHVKCFVASAEKVGQQQLTVPSWFWNLDEWSTFTQATSRAQRPLLRRALRAMRNQGSAAIGTEQNRLRLRRRLTRFRLDLLAAIESGDIKDRAYQFGPRLETYPSDFKLWAGRMVDQATALDGLAQEIERVHQSGKNAKGYYTAYQESDVQGLVDQVNTLIQPLGGVISVGPIGEDTPTEFDAQELLEYLNDLAEAEGSIAFVEFLLERLRAILGNTRMQPIIGKGSKSLFDWLDEMLGDGKAPNVVVVDLSLVPSEIIHMTVAVIARLVFESLQRYRREHPEGKTLPTVMVMEEAHTFIRRYNEDAEDATAATMCSRSFERIAREGRKFGLGLVLSSQRPSELSQTVLSQCNSFILHRLSNERDQEGVSKLLPDNLRSILRELPVLPTRHAYLLGWASELPILTEIRELPQSQRPQSADPDYWAVWVGKNTKGVPVERTVDWKHIADIWQGNSDDSDTDESEEEGGQGPPDVPDSPSGQMTPDTDDLDDLDFLDDVPKARPAPPDPESITGADDDLPF